MEHGLNRRHFIRQTAAIGAGLYVSGKALGTEDTPKDTINIAVLGAGAQGRCLMDAITKKKDKSLRFIAVCDIWDYRRKRTQRMLKAYSKRLGYHYAAYSDYKEMLDTEKDLDAVIVATPDFCHAEHTIACLEKGLHVYCEKPISNTVEDARKMVEAAKQSDKLLQIGHQRRSNPRYLHYYHTLIKESGILGQMTKARGQWNRSKPSCEYLTHRSDKYPINEATLNQYGYADITQFHNWRWFKGLGSGPAVDLGSHQIDVFSWFLEAHPTSIIASGGTDYWKGRQWYDNVTAVYEYQTKAGPVRATYEVCSNSSYDGYFESFMGDQGALKISESYSCRHFIAEHWIERQKWNELIQEGTLRMADYSDYFELAPDAILDIRSDYTPPIYEIPFEFNAPYHQPHLMNFFNAIRGTETLNCPAETGYNTAVAVLKINEAVEQAKRLNFKPDDFYTSQT